MGKPGKPKVLPKFNSQVGILIGKCFAWYVKELASKTYRGAVMGKPGKPKVLPKFNSQVGILIGKCLHGM